MKKRGLLYAIFGLVFYLLFLIITIPASWFAWGLNHFSHGSIRLDPTSGSLWRGNGQLTYYYPVNVPHELGNTEWQVNPFWLFAGHVQMNWQVNAQDTRINTTIRLGSGAVDLIDLDADFPAQLVGTFYPPAVLISPEGRVRLHIGKLTLDHNGMVGDGVIEWQAAGSTLTTVKPLGDYRLEISGTGKTANLNLSTLNGPLELAGRGEWQFMTGQIQFNGSAIPRQRVTELEPLLKLLGDDQGNGKRAITANGSFRFAILPAM